MAKARVIKTSWGAGEIAPELYLRRDTKQYQDGAKSLRNGRVQVTGGVTRRPGTWRLAGLGGLTRIREFKVATSRYLVAFSDEALQPFNLDGTTSGSELTAPWTEDDLFNLRYVQSQDTAFITHESITPQRLTRTGASTWTLADFSFSAGPGGTILQPYYKLAPAEMTLTPSALTGSITLEASDDWFVAGHVGSRFRYQEREMQITAVTDATTATATVIQSLPPTQDLTVSSSTGFQVGHVVEGATTGCKGIVTGVSAGHVIVLVTDRVAGFNGTEDLTGPDAKTTISSIAPATPAATDGWDEQLFSDVNGYPRCCSLHRNRMIFAGHPLVPTAVMGSRPGVYTDFSLGSAEDGDGFFVLIGDGSVGEILHVISAEQLIVLTDGGPYYVPESVSSPFVPSSISFAAFGSPWRMSDAQPARFDGGVVAISASTVLKLAPTGDLTRQWDGSEASLFANHLVKTPVDTAFATSFNGKPERYGFFVNSDGTLAVMILMDAQQVRAFSPWDTEGLFKSVAAMDGRLFAVVARTIDGSTVYQLEEFDQDITLDGAIQASSNTVTTPYADTEMHAVASATVYLGTFTTDGSGEFDLTTGVESAVVGFDYTVEWETLPPETSLDNPVSGFNISINNAKVYVLASGIFEVNDNRLDAYSTSDDASLPPPLKQSWQEFNSVGASLDPTLIIGQFAPLPLTVLGLVMEVSS